MADRALRWTRNILGPGAHTGAEVIRPFIRRFENHSPPVPECQNFPLLRKAALLRQPHRLAPAVLEQLGANSFHML